MIQAWSNVLPVSTTGSVVVSETWIERSHEILEIRTIFALQLLVDYESVRKREYTLSVE